MSVEGVGKCVGGGLGKCGGRYGKVWLGVGGGVESVLG